MAKKVTELKNFELMNMIRANASVDYQDRIPTATQTNISKVSETILNYPTALNEFCNVLTNKVALTLFMSASWDNPFKMLKRGKLPYGKSIEMIFVDLISAIGFEDNFGANDFESLFGRQLTNNVKVQYITENVRLKYKVSISEEQLQGAFFDEYGLGSLVGNLLSRPVQSLELDEYLLIMGLLENAKYKELVTPMPVDNTTSKAFTKKLKSLVSKMSFLSTDYNSAGVINNCKSEDLIIVTTSDVQAELDVEILASAFNIDKVQLSEKMIIVPSFKDEKTVAYVFDKRFIQVWDTLYKTKISENGDELFTNHFLHYWGIYSICTFFNAVRICSEASPVSKKKSLSYNEKDLKKQLDEVKINGTIEKIEVKELK